MKKAKGNYSCSQTLLYRLCAAAWVACGNYLDKFSAYKGFYTATYIAGQQKAIEAAQAMPGARIGVTDRSSGRDELVAATVPVKRKWQNLKSYITEAYAPNMQHSKLHAAGMDLYRRASIEHWDAVTGLIDAANSFMQNNLDALLAGNNMPATFPAEFAAAGKDCMDLSVTFFELENTKTIAVGDKIDANNAIFQSAMSMLKDGQQIFKDVPNVKAVFVFDRQKDIAGGKAAATLTGYIRGTDKLPLQGVMISCSELGYQAFTNEKGYYSIKRMQEGTYTITAAAPGYSVASTTVTLQAGKRSTAGFTLASVLKKVA